MSAHRVVIVGGGFGGLYAARALAKAKVHVTLLDRKNHHVFQPLLYQVATAGLNPADIASPIRHVLRHQANTEVSWRRSSGSTSTRNASTSTAGPSAFCGRSVSSPRSCCLPSRRGCRG